MTKLGIIGAMQVEVEILLGRMENQTSRTCAKKHPRPHGRKK